MRADRRGAGCFAVAAMLLVAGCGAARSGTGPSTSRADGAGSRSSSGTHSLPPPGSSPASTVGGSPMPARPAAARTATATATSGSAGGASPTAGNPAGVAAIPADAQAVDTSHPTHVIGNGTAAGCTSAAVVAAVAAGGIITFDCGALPVTITLTETAKVRNTSSQVVLDGGGKVTLSGGGQRRILYMDTCDQAQVWTTSHCNDQDSPQLAIQNLTFADGNSTGQTIDGGGGGAVFDRGGRVKVVNSVFVRNRCDATGPDLGGAALRVLDQSGGRPVYVVNSTFGGAPGQGGSCSNGGALSSIGVSWIVLNSRFTNNAATGHGANPAAPGTAGGGSGGAIYTDGNRYTVQIAGSVITDNHANAGGGAIFYVSNDRTGTLAIDHTQLQRNPNDGFQTAGLPGIFFLGAHPPSVTNSSIS